MSTICKDKNYDLIITGRESIDYNGGMVGGILATLCEMPYLANCIHLEIDGKNVDLQREIDGGKESLKASLPVVIGAQKGLVEERSYNTKYAWNNASASKTTRSNISK